MLRIVICSEHDLRPEMARSVIGRQGIDVYRAGQFSEAKLLASSLNAQVILVDRDFDGAAMLIERLRNDAVTRSRSVAVVARGDFRADELALLEAGANAILRLPADDSWNDRLAKLLAVPMRQEARLPVNFAVDMEPESTGSILNLSSGGMLLETAARVRLHDELGFHFQLPDGSHVRGRGRIVREAPGAWGVEFTQVSDEQRDAIRSFLRSARLG